MSAPNILKALTGLIGLVVIGGAAYLWDPLPRLPDMTPYIEKAQYYDARIVRDKWGVPHIHGKTDPDAAFGLAYAHAEDDWRTIQETLLFTRGTLARQQGEEAAITDYLMHLLRVKETLARKYESDLRPGTRALVEGYADGFNYWASKNPGKVMPGVLPVTGQDIVAGFVARTPFFYGFDDDLTELFDETRQKDISENRLAGLLSSELGKPFIGSNAFAVAPSRSDDGHTRLLVNSHQPFTGPVAWYEARIKTESGWDITGSLFPGTPMILHGATPNLGWAHTVNKPDLLDIYLLETDDSKKPTQYLLDGQWLPLQRSKAKFRVKLFGPFALPVTRDVLWSQHGPVLVTDHGVYAVRYAGINEVRTVEQWYDMNRAQTYDDWRKALDIRGIPCFNIVYADKNGNVAYFYNAYMPDRQGGWEWRQYLPGDTSDTLWTEYRPLTDLPHIVNPASGWLFNANNTPYTATDAPENLAATDYPASFGIETHLTNRARRAMALYEPDQSISEVEFLSYRDDHSYADTSDLRLMIGSLLEEDFSGEPDLLASQALLKGWDGSAHIDDRAAALAILTGIRARGLLLNSEASSPTDALRLTVADLKKHFGRIDPPWGEVNRLKRGEVNLPVSGGPDTLRAIYALDTFTEDGDLTAVAGDTYILYADWAPDGSQEIRTIHQFGSATLDESSPHYADQAPLFARGEYKAMPMNFDDVLAEATRDYRVGHNENSQNRE